MRTLPTSPRRSASLLRWVVSLLRLPNGWFGFHGEPPVHGPAKNTESSLVRRHRLALLIPYGESMSSSSVIGTTWNFISSFILFCKNVNQFLSSENTRRSMGLLGELRSNWLLGKTLQTLMSSSHKVIWKIEIPEFYFSCLSKGSPTLWDGQPHVCLLQCDIDKGQKHQWWG